MVRKFLSTPKGEVHEMIQEYTDLNHAEPVPDQDKLKNPQEVYYMLIHVVYKNTSTTTKVWDVFDASAKTASGITFNDTLMVGPTVYPQLVNVLMKFRIHTLSSLLTSQKCFRPLNLHQLTTSTITSCAGRNQTRL